MGKSTWRNYNNIALQYDVLDENINLNNLDDYLKKNNCYFGQWIENWDCDRETEFWYIIKDKKIDLSKLKSKYRSEIKRGLNNSYAKIINPLIYKEEMYSVFENATKKYDNYNTYTKIEEFYKQIESSIMNREYWGVFLKEDNKLVAYAENILHEKYVDFSVIKLNPEYLNLKISNTIIYDMTNFYLNKGYKFVCDGQRSIRHSTNIQKYLMKTFGFRKAFCFLNIRYGFKSLKLIISILYPLRKMIFRLPHKFDIFKNIGTVLKIEEIYRECKKIKKGGENGTSFNNNSTL